MKIELLKYADKLFGVLFTKVLMTPRSRPIPDLRRILIIRPGGIGDAVHLIPAIHSLKQQYSESEITVLAEKRNSAVFAMCPEVNRVFLYDRPRELLTALRYQCDLVIDTEQWHRLSAVVARLARTNHSIGYSTNERKKLFMRALHYSHSEYEMESFFNLLNPLGIIRRKAVLSPFLDIPERARVRAEALLGGLATKPFVTIFPGASIPERRWGADNLGKVAACLHQMGIPVVVVGGRGDEADGEKIIAGKFGLNLVGKSSLVETAAVIDKSIILISGDSGILHIGFGLGKPTVSLFGPGIAKKWAPRGDKHIVINKNLPCSPCTRFGYTPRCPINARCMSEITVDEVVAAAVKLIGAGPK